jgi:hypothetical protein
MIQCSNPSKHLHHKKNSTLLLGGKKKQQCPTFLDAIITTTSKHYSFINPIPPMHLLILALLQNFKP